MIKDLCQKVLVVDPVERLWGLWTLSTRTVFYSLFDIEFMNWHYLSLLDCLIFWVKHALNFAFNQLTSKEIQECNCLGVSSNGLLRVVWKVGNAIQ